MAEEQLVVLNKAVITVLNVTISLYMVGTAVAWSGNVMVLPLTLYKSEWHLQLFWTYAWNFHVLIKSAGLIQARCNSCSQKCTNFVSKYCHSIVRNLSWMFITRSFKGTCEACLPVAQTCSALSRLLLMLYLGNENLWSGKALHF